MSKTTVVHIPGAWRPRAYQLALWRYLEGGGLRADVAAHRRWGKDEVALNWTAVAALQRQGAYWHLLPEASQGRKAIWDAVNPHTGRRRIDEAFPPELRSQTKDQEMFIRFRNGSTWQVVGSDNYNSLVGSPPAGVVFSEWALAKPDAWTYLRPILAENGGWTTRADSTAREYILPGGGRIVAGRLIGAHLLVWTDHALFLGAFVGSLSQPWRFDRVGEKCGLIGPNAAVVIGQQAFWISPDRQFYSYGLGGGVAPLACPVRRDFEEHLAASQGDKIVASSLAQRSEVWFDYPDTRDGDGIETSRFLAFTYAGPDAGAWFKGQMARTARTDAGPSTYPAATTRDGRLYWHERGHSADGESHSWFIESSDLVLNEELQARISGIWPDFRDQEGPAFLTIACRDKPQGLAVVKGPYAIAAGAARIDVRATGRYHRLRFAGAGAPARLHFGKPVLDVTTTGAR